MSGTSSLSVRHFVSELTGGTGVAALRLHRGLHHAGIESSLHYRSGFQRGARLHEDRRHRAWFWRLFQAYVIRSRWSHQHHNRGIFIHARWIYRTRLDEFGPAPDVVNLHLLFRWLDLPSFFSSIPSKLPVIWSLHDIHAATGGCIHPLECDHFATHCHDCPSLKQAGRHDRSWHEFRLKDRLYQRLNLHIVGNSEWTTAQARRSALMRHAKSVHTIPLGLSVDDFKPIDKSCARQVLGISSDRFVVGFACTDFSDPNKGGELLRKALCQLAEQTEIALLTYGGEFPSEGRGGYQILELGRLTSPLLQSLFYSACDVFALPSRTESFGLTALEAMACGTPVVGFRSGGPAEVIADGETGLLSKTVGKVDELYTNLRWLHQHPAERQRMGRKARDRVVHKFSSTLMAERYAELYRSLVGTSK